MKKLAFIMGAMLVGIVVLLGTDYHYKVYEHDHQHDTDPDEVWWG